jgi:2-polyprenyl-3-methyl-5-hydroxy-6-metoxy-1,4-benzoquinol methylase
MQRKRAAGFDFPGAMNMTEMTTALATLKARLKSTWEAGNYGHFARPMEQGALEFLARQSVPAGTRVLDVACGAGQIAIPMARAGADVVGIDLASNLVAQARARAQAENLRVRFDQGDAEELPYADASFDLVVSLIGAMFAPRPERVAAELLRVCRPGGRIVMANWTATGFVGLLFKAMGKHVAPPANIPSPLLWGDETVVRERFRTGTRQLTFARRLYPFDYPFPPGAVVDFYRAYYGPANRAFAVLDGAGQARLHADLERLWSEHNLDADGSTRYTAEYLEVVAVRE